MMMVMMMMMMSKTMMLFQFEIGGVVLISRRQLVVNCRKSADVVVLAAVKAPEVVGELVASASPPE